VPTTIVELTVIGRLIVLAPATELPHRISPIVMPFPASVYPLPWNVIAMMFIPAVRSFVVARIVDDAGNERASPALGAWPLTQLAPLDQLPSTGVVFQLWLAARAKEAAAKTIEATRTRRGARARAGTRWTPGTRMGSSVLESTT